MAAIESPEVFGGPKNDRGVSDLSISVVIPTRHEARTIGPFIRRVLSALPHEQAKVVVVDDSDDDTPRVLAELARDLDRHLERDGIELFVVRQRCFLNRALG